MDNQSQTDAGPEAPTNVGARILLAEDNYEMRKLLLWSLRRNGYTVVECPDGACILKKLGLTGEEPGGKFDLIISDIRMPGVTGLEVLEGANIFDELPPIILITAFPDKETLAEAERLGAAAVFAKPFDVDELLLKVRQTLPLQKRTTAEIELASQKPDFPLEITYRRQSGAPAIDAYIRERAAKMNRFAEHVLQCRVIIDEFRKNDHKKHRRQVEVILNVGGKSIVGKHDASGGDENLYYAVQIAFAAVYNELKKYLQKRRNYRTEKQ